MTDEMQPRAPRKKLHHPTANMLVARGSWKKHTRLCTSAMVKLSKKMQVDDVLWILDEMPRRGAERNAFHYAAAMSACTNANLWMTALDLLLQMQREKIAPTVISCNAVIAAYARGGQPGSTEFRLKHAGGCRARRRDLQLSNERLRKRG